jgi:DNA replication ATP-dependent helicase Dna2
MPGTQTRTKLKAFQFIEGKPSINPADDQTDKENAHQRLEVPKQTPVKPLRQKNVDNETNDLPPSTPAMRLPLSDLIGNPEERRDTISKETLVEEHVLWQHNQTPTSSRPAMTPARKRKRARSSSPASSQVEPANFSSTKEPFDVQGLQHSLRTPQADPAADLWSRYASANDGTGSNNKSTAFAHLLRDSSPGSSATKGSISGLRRWASCGVEWPVSATKNKRRRIIPREDEPSEDDREQQKDGLPKKSTVGLLLKRMKESLSKPPERVADGPSSSSPLPERSAMEEYESPQHRLAAVQEEESPVSKHFGSSQRGAGMARKSFASSSEYGDDDIDFDMLEAVESTAIFTHSQPKPTIQKLSPIMEEVLPPSPTKHAIQQPRSQPQALAPQPTSVAPVKPQVVYDEFGDDDDDLFAEDLELVASVYENQATKPLFQHKSLVSGKVYEEPRGRTVQILSDDEFGDDDIDDGLFAAAEIAATQAFKASGAAPLHVCTGSYIYR